MPKLWPVAFSSQKKPVKQLAAVYSRRLEWQQLRVIQSVIKSYSSLCCGVFFFSYQEIKELENDLMLYQISLLSIFLNCGALQPTKIIVLKISLH